MISAILRAQFLSLRPRARTRKGGAIVSAATGALFYGFWGFLSFGIMLYLLFFLLRDGATLAARIRDAIPLSAHHKRHLFSKFTTFSMNAA